MLHSKYTVHKKTQTSFRIMQIYTKIAANVREK